jgi:hypothetical protein
MPSKRELYDKCKSLGLKNISKLNKKQLEEALIIYQANNWFNNLIEVSFNSNTLDLSGNITLINSE